MPIPRPLLTGQIGGEDRGLPEHPRAAMQPRYAVAIRPLPEIRNPARPVVAEAGGGFLGRQEIPEAIEAVRLALAALRYHRHRLEQLTAAHATASTCSK